MAWTYVSTIWGTFVAQWEGASLARLLFPNGHTEGWAPTQAKAEPSEVLKLQLAEYFKGSRKAFTVPLCPRGSSFQLQVWEELLRVPFAHTITYGALARRVGRPTGARAVGGAVGANPIPILIPCHRVVRTGGGLGGFGAGADWKSYLLRLEGVGGDSWGGDSPPGVT